MHLFESLQFGLLAEGWVELIGPILIFGIYIIGSIAKNVAQRNQESSGEEGGSELKKAVRKRYEQIRRKQVGEESPHLKRTPKAVPTARTIRPENKRTSQWEQQQQAIRQRNARLQEQRIAAERRVIQTQKTVVGYERPKPSRTIRQVVAPKPVHKQKKTAVPKQVSEKASQPPKCRHTGGALGDMMCRPENLRSAIILKEILDKPLALRDF